MVQRSPSHFQTGTFYWSHVGVVYQTTADGSMRRCVWSMRPLLSWEVWTCKSSFPCLQRHINSPSVRTADLRKRDQSTSLIQLTRERGSRADHRCYGRWDTPQHVLTDEDHTQPDGPDGPIWRGKDYSNERVMEYSNLDKPFEDMFDRSKVPRMPW